MNQEGVIREMRNAVRFPLQLPIEVKGDRKYQAEMRDISAGGVLFSLDSELQKGTEIQFTILLPAGSLSVPSDVRVQCAGRVVRTYEEGGKVVVAAVIDEYNFER